MQAQQSTWIPERGTPQAVALEILRHGPLARSDVAKRLNLSAATLTRLAGPLIDAGLLEEVGERAQEGAGRPKRLLDVKPKSRHFIGMKLTGEQVLGVVTDLRANVVHRAEHPLPSREPDSVVAQIRALAQRLADAGYDVTALGIGVGALTRDGAVLAAPFLGWEDVPLERLVEQSTGIPTVVDNDVVALTEGEHWFGAGRGLERFAVVTLGAGVGYGTVINGGIVVDEDAGIGLVGHWPLDPMGPLCPAGHRGCARSVLTRTAIIDAVSGVMGREVSYDEALDAAEDGHPGARRVVDDAGRGLGRLLAAIANLTAPELVVVGGEGVRLVSVARAAVDEGMRADRDPRARRIPLATMAGDDADWCRGAAVLAIQTFALGT